jgi:hypothetical protein
VATSAAVATGTGNTLGNKGGVSVYFKICGTWILVLNAHLTAHQNAEKRRNADFRKISTMMPLLLEKKETIEMIEVDHDTSNGMMKVSTESSHNGPTVAIGEVTTPSANTTTTTPPPSSFQLQLPQPIPQENVHVAPVNPVDTTAGGVGLESAVTSPSTFAGGMTIAAGATTTIIEDGDKDEDDLEEANGNLDQSNMPSFQERPSSLSFSGSPIKTIDKIADMVIFMGDLNYRIQGNRSVDSIVLNIMIF